MTCILRVAGEDLDIDTLLQGSPLSPDRVWRKGEVRNGKGELHDNSGATFLASGADLEQFNQQVEDATLFLELHSTAISSIAAFPGVEWVVLDFGIELRDTFLVHSAHLPSRFLKAVASTGIGVELSHYLCNDDEES